MTGGRGWDAILKMRYPVSCSSSNEAENTTIIEAVARESIRGKVWFLVVDWSFGSGRESLLTHNCPKLGRMVSACKPRASLYFIVTSSYGSKWVSRRASHRSSQHSYRVESLHTQNFLEKTSASPTTNFLI